MNNTHEDDVDFELGEGSDDISSVLPTGEKIGHYFSIFTQSPISHNQLNKAADGGWHLAEMLPIETNGRVVGYVVYLRYDGFVA